MLEPLPQTLLLKVPPSRSNITIISQCYTDCMRHRLTTGVSSSSSSPSHFDLTTADFFDTGGGAGVVLACAAFVGFPFAEGSKKLSMQVSRKDLPQSSTSDMVNFSRYKSSHFVLDLIGFGSIPVARTSL